MFWQCVGRRQRVAAGAAHARSGQAGRAVRRHLSHHRFHAVELPQQRPAPDSRAHAVQGDEPRPPHHARLAELSVPRAGRVHRRRAAAAADRRAVVPGHGRRRLPEHLHAGKGAAANTSSSWPATTSTRWTTASWSPSTRTTNADVTIAALRVQAKEAARQFGIMQVDDDEPRHRLRGKAGRAQDDPRQPGLLPGVDGHLRVQRAVPVRRAVQATPRCRTARTTSAGTSFRR